MISSDTPRRIVPILNEDTGMWEVKQSDVLGMTFPLPGGMTVEASTEYRAQELCVSIAEQLEGLGLVVGV